MKDVYPQFADDVDFYAVNIDPTDDMESLEKFRENQGYPWPIAHSGRDALATLDVTYQSTKVAIDGDGVIVYRENMGGGDVEKWRKVFEELSDA